MERSLCYLWCVSSPLPQSHLLSSCLRNTEIRYLCSCKTPYNINNNINEFFNSNEFMRRNVCSLTHVSMNNKTLFLFIKMHYILTFTLFFDRHTWCTYHSFIYAIKTGLFNSKVFRSDHIDRIKRKLLFGNSFCWWREWRMS